MNMKLSLCSEKFETFEIWAMNVHIRGPRIVMSRTDAQNGLDFHFNFKTSKFTDINCINKR
jgi:hypothetical protein